MNERKMNFYTLIHGQWLEGNCAVAEHDVIEYAATAYSFLIGRNEKVTLSQFADRIAATYDLGNPRNHAVYQTLKAVRPCTI